MVENNKRKYIGALGIGSLIPEVAEKEQKGIRALVEEPSNIDGIAGLHPKEGNNEMIGAHALVDQPSQIDGFQELKKKREMAIA